MDASPGQNKAVSGPDEAPGADPPTPWEEMDLSEAAARWRKKAEAFWKLSRHHERLAHEHRLRAHHAEAMAGYLSGTGKWPKPPPTGNLP